jgi:hypothetical protein
MAGQITIVVKINFALPPIKNNIDNNMHIRQIMLQTAIPNFLEINDEIREAIDITML